MNIIVKELLKSSTGYWTLNKTLVKELGLTPAFLLTNLAEAESLMADEDGWFYQTVKTVEEVTTLTRYKQDTAIEKLKGLGIIEVETRGLPPKRYFRLNYGKVAQIIENSTSKQIVKKPQINSSKNHLTNSEKTTTNKEHIYKEHNNKGIYVPEEKAKDNNITKEELTTIRDKWNSIAEGTRIPKIRTINRSTKRFSMLNARYKDYGLETLLEGIDSIRRSSFLKGETSANWCITFDWYIAPNNIIKVLEGNYIDKSSPTSTTLNNPDYRVSTKEDLARDDDGNLIVF